MSVRDFDVITPHLAEDADRVEEAERALRFYEDVQDHPPFEPLRFGHLARQALQSFCRNLPQCDEMVGVADEEYEAVSAVVFGDALPVRPPRRRRRVPPARVPRTSTRTWRAS